MSDREIATLLDKEAIRNLRIRFGEGVDKRNWPALQSIFHDTVDADLSALGLAPSQMPRDAFIALFKHSFRNADIRTQQVYSSFLIEVDGDRATCRSCLIGHHYSAGFPGGETFELRAEYVDELIRTDDGWRIAKVMLHVTSAIGNMRLIA